MSYSASRSPGRHRPTPRHVRDRGAEIILGVVAGLVPAALIAFFLLGGGTAPGSADLPSPDARPSNVAVASVVWPASSPSPPPSATLEPTAVPTMPPTPRPSDRPATEAPAPIPPGPTDGPPGASTDGGPARAVETFYEAVVAHDWEAAIGLWSPAMQERYPPEVWLIDRFRQTTRIEITRLDRLSIDREAGRARVAVTLVEHRSVGPSPRTFVGAWDLVRVDGRWLLDAPYF